MGHNLVKGCYTKGLVACDILSDSFFQNKLYSSVILRDCLNFLT